MPVLTRHLRRCALLYAGMAAWLSIVVAFPSVAPSTGTSGRGLVAGVDSSAALTGTDPGPAAPGPGGAPSTATGSTPDTPGGTAPAGPAPATAGGFDSATGPTGSAARRGPGTDGPVGCLPYPDGFRSAYLPPCRPAGTSGNPGVSWPGVSSKTIRIVNRISPPGKDTATYTAYFRDVNFNPDAYDAARKVFIEYFNKVFQLFGRRVELVDYKSQHGDSTAENTGGGREGACLDARDIKGMGAYAVIGYASKAFSICAAERGMVVLGAALHAPESFYARYHPFLWNLEMDCERVVIQLAEYVGKRLAGRPARWAGDPNYQEGDRKFGVYVPDNDEFQLCAQILVDTLRREYGVTGLSTYSYRLEAQRFAEQAAAAVRQFKADDVTSLLPLCDSMSFQALTYAALSQDWRPEWIVTGVDSQDTVGVVRLAAQVQVDGHLFGRSYSNDEALWRGPNSEPARLYRRITGQPYPSDIGSGNYWGMLDVFTMLQAAGPHLTPYTMAAGAFRLPRRGAPTYPLGAWDLRSRPDGRPGFDHTLIDDNREIYWDADATAFDGERGDFIATYGGRRFGNGEWPREEPPVYPDD